MKWRLTWFVFFSASLSMWIPPAAAAGSAPVADKAGTQPNDESWRNSVEQELKGDILPFWIQHTVDHERGGYYGEITNDLRVKKDAVRGALLTSRILWTYSAAYLRFKDPAYLKMATWAYDDLMKRFWDQKFGGLIWSATADGKPVSQVKQVYGQVFGIYALSEYFRASHDQAALDRAIEIYRLVEKNAKDPKFGGYFEACTRDWKVDTSRRTSVMEPEGAKSQNTHIHVLEAYTNFLRAWPDAELKKSHRELIDVLLNKIVNPQTHHLILFLTADWKPTTKTISYGHDIEFSWLITEAAEMQGDEQLEARAKKISLEMAAATYAEGVDTDGSLLYEAEPTGVTNSNREWWPQAEAAVGFYNAYQLSGDERYRTASMRVWGYIETNLVDHKNGEWFRARTKAGKIIPTDKVSMWKCPYHNGRACMQLLQRLDHH